MNWRRLLQLSTGFKLNYHISSIFSPTNGFRVLATKSIRKFDFRIYEKLITSDYAQPFSQRNNYIHADFCNQHKIFSSRSNSKARSLAHRKWFIRLINSFITHSWNGKSYRNWIYLQLHIRAKNYLWKITLMVDGGLVFAPPMNLYPPDIFTTSQTMCK